MITQVLVAIRVPKIRIYLFGTWSIHVRSNDSFCTWTRRYHNKQRVNESTKMKCVFLNQLSIFYIPTISHLNLMLGSSVHAYSSVAPQAVFSNGVGICDITYQSPGMILRGDKKLRFFGLLFFHFFLPTLFFWRRKWIVAILCTDLSIGSLPRSSIGFFDSIENWYVVAPYIARRA